MRQMTIVVLAVLLAGFYSFYDHAHVYAKETSVSPQTVTINSPQEQPPNIPSWAKPLDQPTVAANSPQQQVGTAVDSDEQTLPPGFVLDTPSQNPPPAESAPTVTPELLFSLLFMIGVAMLLFFLWRIFKTIAAKFHPQDESKSHRQQTAPPHATIHTHYDRLKVVRDAPSEVIAAAYKSLSKIHHPDRNPGNAEAAKIMTLINASYDILSDPDKRRQYDLWLQQQEREAHTTKQTEAEQPGSAKTEHKIKKGGSSFFAQLLRYWIPFGLAALIASIWLIDQPNPPQPGPKPYLSSPPPVSPPVNSVWVRPATAPNGQPWPASAAYIKGYERLHAGGLSTVTIDNSHNGSDVFVKLVSLDHPQTYFVRQFFIPARKKFTLKKVTAGTYDIRYRDLASGELARSESFRLKEEPTNDGTRYSDFTMTLYKVRDGNMNTFALSEEEF
jgi:curved DNA-binding protein CbpA